jgi:DNA-directed RNA polymerase I, II, and III subunit RPABC2
MDNESYFSDDEKKEESDDESDTSSIEEVENEDTEIEEIEVPDDDEDNAEVSDEEDSETNSQTGGVKDFEEDENNTENNQKKIKKIPGKNVNNNHDDNEEDDDDDGEMYLQKFDKEVNDNYIVNFHPESILHNYDEILAMIQVVRDTDDIIIDDLHKTIPYLTKYERARILGQRAVQINSGATTFVKVPEKIIDGYFIAELELQEKRIPFIIRRPLPNGGSEYWCVKDLENIAF